MCFLIIFFQLLIQNDENETNTSNIKQYCLFLITFDYCVFNDILNITFISCFYLLGEQSYFLEDFPLSVTV
jgi:hypothetical protein